MTASSKPARPPLTRDAKVRDVVIGFSVQLLIAALTAGAIWTGTALLNHPGELARSEVVQTLIQVVLSIGSVAAGWLSLIAMIAALIWRRWMALGMLVWFGVLFLLAIVAGIFLLAQCFTTPGAL